MSAAHDVFAFVPAGTLSAAHFVAGLIVLAEALNKLERCAPFARGICGRARFAAALKCIAWILLAMGGAGAMVTPLMQLDAPTLQDCAVIVGFAVLIVRSRFKEFET